MNGSIRKAQLSDVPHMVELSEQKRLQYQRYQPVFWRKAEDSRQVQLTYFEGLVLKENIIALVYEQDKQIKGFVIAMLHSAPPVYKPEGLTCTIDDFCVAEPENWSTVGTDLLHEVACQAKEQGAVQIVVVCGHLDQSKREMLASESFNIASEWYVKNT